MTAGPTIDYEALAQEAMRGVVRTVLSRAAKTGLPGDHHFYISFDTQAPGVVMSKRLKEKYPSEMTIVLQHRFWDLLVSDERFEVKLTFDGIPERLVVPFTALKVFFDPSVRYGLQFDDHDAAQEVAGNADGRDEQGSSAPITTRSSSPRKPRPQRAPAKLREKETAGAEAAPQPAAPAADVTRKPGEGAPRPMPATGRPALTPVPPPAAKPAAASSTPTPTPPAEKAAPPLDEPANKPAAPSPAGAQIVSLDSFRKK